MEHLEGETLQDRLTKGTLPLERALHYAIEIADALDKAHRQGIVHRDLKPGNIMLTKAGAKLLDFGLAKLRPPGDVGAETVSAANPDNAALTERGTLMGTLPYMAPEQLDGRPGDARTDLFAFGAVLHEMITGGRAFAGDTQARLIASILESHPAPLSTARPNVPFGLDRLVSTCLAKDPDERWQTARDLKRELEWAVEGSPGAGAPFSEQSPQQGWRPILIAALGVSIVAAAIWYGTRASPGALPVIRTVVTFPLDQQLVLGGRANPLTISSDGRRLVYAAQSAGTTRLYLRELARFEASPIRDSEGARHPFFSPDGEWVGFFADGRLKKTAVAGGLAIELCEVSELGRGATWAPNDTIVFDQGPGLGLATVSADGGTPEPLTTPAPETDHRWPQFLSDGSAVLFTIGTTNQLDTSLAAVSPGGGEHRTLGRGSQARSLPSGHVVYHAGAGDLFVAPFDAQRLELGDPSVPVLDGLYRAPDGGGLYFTVSETGSLVYVRGGFDRSLVEVDRQGQATVLTDDRRGFRYPRLAPDGQRLAVTIDPRPSEIWVYHLGRGTRTRLAAEGHNLVPVWTPDGNEITFSSDRGGSMDMYSTSADASGSATILVERTFAQYPTAWSRNGQHLAFIETSSATGRDVWMLPREGEPTAFATTLAHEYMAVFSPDDRCVAYVSDESGRDDVYLRPHTGPETRAAVSPRGGTAPVWSPDGRELFYREGTRMMVVRTRTEVACEAENPEVLFNRPHLAVDLVGTNYDIFPDGQRFLMVQIDPESTPNRLNVVQNWHRELLEGVPVP